MIKNSTDLIQIILIGVIVCVILYMIMNNSNKIYKDTFLIGGNQFRGNKNLEREKKNIHRNIQNNPIYDEISDEFKVDGELVELPDEIKKEGTQIRDKLKRMISKNDNTLNFLIFLSKLLCIEERDALNKFIKNWPDPELPKNIITSTNLYIITLRKKLRIGCDVDNTILAISLIPIVGRNFRPIIELLHKMTGKMLDTTEKLMLDNNWTTNDAKLKTPSEIEKALPNNWDTF